MNKRNIIVSATAMIVALSVMSATAYVQADTKEVEEQNVTVQQIKWRIPDEFKVADTVVKYNVEVENSQYQFDPNAYLSTNDDNLTNYASPILNTWSLTDVAYTDYEAPVLDSDSKTFMRFQKLGYNEGNKQSAICRGSYAYTGDYCIRMVDGRYLIALGTYYTSTIGQYVDIVLENGTVLPCILGDVKSPTHTDDTNRYQRWDKSVMEFIVDSPVIEQGADDEYAVFRAATGIEYSFSEISEFNSKVKAIRVYDKVYPYVMGDIMNDNPDYY